MREMKNGYVERLMRERKRKLENKNKGFEILSSEYFTKRKKTFRDGWKN